MSVNPSGGRKQAGSRRDLTVAIKRSLRELRNQLAQLNRQIGLRVDLKEVDHDCLDLIARDGPISPSTLAQKTRLHPATITGILDRLERDRWIARARADADRRSVLVSARDRVGAIVSLYAGMNTRMDAICANYTSAQLAFIADFLRRTTDAGCRATTELARD
jgi:DNA-binding MarR family transcriptional regulator